MMNTWQRYMRSHPRGLDLALALLLITASLVGSRFSPPVPAPSRCGGLPYC